MATPNFWVTKVEIQARDKIRVIFNKVIDPIIAVYAPFYSVSGFTATAATAVLVPGEVDGTCVDVTFTPEFNTGVHYDLEVSPWIRSLDGSTLGETANEYSTFGIDANTVSLWRCDETAPSDDLVDSAGPWRLLPINQQQLTGGVGVIAGQSMYGARSLPAGVWTNPYFTYSTSAGPPELLPLIDVFTGSYTLEGWVKLEEWSASGQCIFFVGSNGEQIDNNYLISLTLTPEGLLSAFWEYGEGVNVSATSTTPITLGAWNYFAVRKTDLGGGMCDVDIITNTAMDSFPGINGPAATGVSWLMIGSQATGALLKGSLDNIRLSKVARSDLEIAEYRDFPSFTFPASTNGTGNFSIASMMNANTTTESPVILMANSLVRPPSTFFAIRPEVTSTEVVVVQEPDVTFICSLISGKVKVQFSEDILHTESLEVTSSYSITPPTGAPSVSVTHVEVFSDYLLLSLSLTETVNGGVYTLSLPQSLAYSSATGKANDAGTSVFVGSSVPASVSFVSPRHASDGSGVVRVVFTREVSDTALNTANYSITSSGGSVILAITGITRLGPREIEISTAPQSSVVYNLTISGVKDLVGNEVV